MMTLHSTTIDRTGPIISNKDAELILSGQTTFSKSKDDQMCVHMQIQGCIGEKMW
ncbi:MAG: hypothetical protein Ct9H90mP23_2080 [Methanobacteriota archaeon]|nr:MAG: hypothetical protein Ct9H90mP23_2080 [Euryarchaeota archaeon]